MTQTEALKLAMAALEDAKALLNGKDGTTTMWFAEEITAIKEALAEHQQEPEQSEIFCGVDFADGLLSVSVLRGRADDVAELLHLEQIALPAQKQKPVAMHEDWYNSNSCGHCGMVGGHSSTCRHYTTPPQRTWVGLTEDEISKLVYSCDYDEYEELVRATEAKLKEKNHG